MTVYFRPPPAGLTADSEQILVSDVRRGVVPMGWIPTRAWDTQGVRAFTALQAPFLVTDYTLLKKVLTGDVAKRMLSGTRAKGVRTLGLAATDLRRPLGVRGFASAKDFHGAKLRVPGNSTVTAAMLDALGASASSIASGTDLYNALETGEVDGAETSFGFILVNSYFRIAPYVTVNIVFFPRVDAISVNEGAFSRLTREQREILQKAAQQTASSSTAGLAKRDQTQLRLLCAGGVKAVTSTAAELSELKRAEQTVYSLLEKDKATARRIAEIRALKKRTRPSAPPAVPVGCAA